MAAYNESMNPMCIILVTDEWTYAFNLDSRGSTTSLYNELVARYPYAIIPITMTSGLTNKPIAGVY